MSARACIALALIASLAGCAVGPDFHRPQAPGVNGYTREPLAERSASASVAGGQEQRFVQGMDLPGRWWELFHSPELNTLVEQALRLNPDAQGAQAALRQANELVAAQRGALFPEVDASFSPTRQKNATGTLAPTLASGASIFNLYTAQVGVSYVLDVFGKTRRQIEVQEAQALYQRFQLEATYLTLSSNVVAAAVQEAGLRAQIAATDEVIRIQEEVVQIFRKQYELGAIAMSDVLAQEAALAQTRATLPALRKQLALQRDLLARLAGRFPSDEPQERFELATLTLPVEIPVSLPSKLVDQRPDVRAAEAQLHAASAQAGVATADMLPQITLSATAGSASTRLADLLGPGNAFWTLGASLSQTLFAGGSLLHQKRAAEAALDQAGAQYRGVVLTAFQNVADTLRALEFDAQAVQAQAQARDAASASLQLSRRALELGSISYLSLLNAQSAYEQATLALAQAQTNRYADTAALFQALGGGWWNRTAAADRDTTHASAVR